MFLKKNGREGKRKGERETEKENGRTINLFVAFTLLAPRKAVGGVKPAVSSRIQSRPTGSGSKIGTAKSTPPKKVTKAGTKPTSGTSAAKGAASAANAAELKALQEQVAQLQDQVSPTVYSIQLL